MNMVEIQHAADQFGLKGQCTIVKDSAKVNTPEGFKCIKKVNYSVERLLFIHDVKEHLVQRGLKFIDRFIKAPSGYPYVVHNNDIYVLIDWIDGKECDFDNMAEIKTAIEGLARFHGCSEGYLPSENIKAKNELGKLPLVLKKRSDEFLKLKKIAKKGKNRFDYVYMENVDFYLEKSLNSLKILSSPAYERLVEKAERSKGICHRDYSYHNLILSREGGLYIINFDYCCYEIRAYDLISFLRKIMSECNWNVEVAMNVINWYDTVSRLDEDEIKIIAALMEYPQKFWRIANRYYNSKRTKPEIGFYNKLSDVISEKEFYCDFVDKFKENMVSKYKA